MMLKLYLPWYLNSFFVVLVFLTLLWQTYYCQIFFSAALKNKYRLFLEEGAIIISLLALVYMVEASYSYVIYTIFLPFLWWRIWENSKRINKLVYEDINYNTYKQAWDSLPVPVAIANEDKELVLVNEAMYDFLSSYVKRKVRNIEVLWRYLELPTNHEVKVSKEAGRLILSLPNGQNYWAEMESFRLEQNNYWQVTLMDITNQERIFAKERASNVIDVERSSLVQLLNSLEDIKRQEVAEEIHGRVHDFMGQRIAALQRFLSQEDNQDYSKLIPMLQNVLQDMRAATFQNPQEQLNNIVNTFVSLGLELKIIGKLPSREDWATCFVNIIREGATNAVRHGEATMVTVQMEQKEAEAIISISSNGKVPENFVKGKGLQGIEKSLRLLNGSLEILIDQSFVLQGRVGLKADENFNS